MMASTVKITEEVVFEQDVKTMSYEQLMDSIRFLDHERQMIAKRVEKKISIMANHANTKKISNQK